MSSHSDFFAVSGNSPTVDFLRENHGSIFLLRPLTPSATYWLEKHIGQDNGFQPYWPTCVIEHRYIRPVLKSIQNDGLPVIA
jgi:hypothetical protein